MIIILVLNFKFKTSASYRSIPKIICAMADYSDIKLKAPSHTTIINWSKKLGIHQLKPPGKKANDWVIILDESVEFGYDKLLVVLGIRFSDIDFSRPIQYSDMNCLALRVSDSWKAEEIKTVLEEVEQQFGKIKYAVADMGNAITKALKLFGKVHIEDCTHKLSLIIKHIYQNDERFVSYTKLLAHLRGSLCLSKISHLLPPKQRMDSRFMNLRPLFDWGKAIKVMLDSDIELQLEREKLSIISEHKEIIEELNGIIEISYGIQELLKNKGLSKETLKESILLFPKICPNRGLESFKIQTIEYLTNMTKNLKRNKKIICTSDIIESSFGKYKNYISENLSVGITDLSLTIAAFTCNLDDRLNIKEAMETVKTNDILMWRQQNIPKSLLKKRQEILKMGGRKKCKT
jgi:hypothetical protein